MSDEPITNETYKIPAQRETEVFANANGAISIRQEAIFDTEAVIIEIRPENINQLINMLRLACGDLNGAE